MLCRKVSSIFRLFNYSQRFAALRCGGFLALLFIRSTNVEPCTNVSTEHGSPHNAKPLLAAAVFFVRNVVIGAIILPLT